MNIYFTKISSNSALIQHFKPKCQNGSFHIQHFLLVDVELVSQLDLLLTLNRPPSAHGLHVGSSPNVQRAFSYSELWPWKPEDWPDEVPKLVGARNFIRVTCPDLVETLRAVSGRGSIVVLRPEVAEYLNGGKELVFKASSTNWLLRCAVYGFWDGAPDRVVTLGEMLWSVARYIRGNLSVPTRLERTLQPWATILAMLDDRVGVVNFGARSE
jgi:hypothetical protein